MPTVGKVSGNEKVTRCEKSYILIDRRWDTWYTAIQGGDYVENPLNARIVKWDIFNPFYPKENLFWKEMGDTYVGDSIGEEEMRSWFEPENRSGYCLPVLISAQTGRGKNYFVEHNLREFAKSRGERILYISNRVALDYQQKKEFATLTGTLHNMRTFVTEDLEREETFGNVSVITYQKLLGKLNDSETRWFNQFAVVVIDECHFFCSDALFNPYTGYILEKIIKLFSSRVRIYMSATFDDVIEPIRYYEGRIGRNSPTFSEFTSSRRKYHFPRDFSNYIPICFTNLEQIASRIKNDKNKKDKWLIFVTSKNEGEKLCNKLNEWQDRSAWYVDSESRYSKDFDLKYMWEYLKENGNFESKVLIATSVLDNGFSIKDDKIKNIVICALDKTQFLQELGRYRIGRDKKVNLYIQKYTPTIYARQREWYQECSRFFDWFYGTKEKERSSVEAEFAPAGDPLEATLSLWKTGENKLRSLVHLAKKDDCTLKPYVNDLARWRIHLLGEQLEEYNRLKEEAGERASSEYVLRWLYPKGGCDFEDLDITDRETKFEELLSFLKECAKLRGALKEGGQEFEDFALEFQKKYKEAFPEDTSLSRSKLRVMWRHTAIRNHLVKVNNLISDKGEFTFTQAGDKGMFVLGYHEEY